MQYPDSSIEICIENPHSIFRGLSPKEKESISGHHTLVVHKKGDYIYTEGEKARGVVCLASGKAKIFRTGVGGREQVLRFLKPGDITGYRFFFTGGSWQDSAMTIEESVSCLIDKGIISKILKRNPELSFRLSKIFTDELQYAYNRLISLTQKHVRGRLAESLLFLVNTYGFEADMKTLRISLSRDDLAHYSSMTTANAIRTLSNMANEGIIELKGKRILILDNHRLEQISESG
jgi:CRP-like cAMP-binding protein